MAQFRITHVCDVYHLTTTNDTASYELTPSITQLNASIYPAGTDILMTFPGIPAYSAYQMLVWDDVEIKNGDKIISGSEEWIVRGVPRIFNDMTMYVQDIIVERIFGS